MILWALQYWKSKFLVLMSLARNASFYELTASCPALCSCLPWGWSTGCPERHSSSLWAASASDYMWALTTRGPWLLAHLSSWKDVPGWDRSPRMSAFPCCPWCCSTMEKWGQMWKWLEQSPMGMYTRPSGIGWQCPEVKSTALLSNFLAQILTPWSSCGLGKVTLLLHITVSSHL
jgi:hypothetical protein